MLVPFLYSNNSYALRGQTSTQKQMQAKRFQRPPQPLKKSSTPDSRTKPKVYVASGARRTHTAKRSRFCSLICYFSPTTKHYPYKQGTHTYGPSTTGGLFYLVRFSTLTMTCILFLFRSTRLCYLLLLGGRSTSTAVRLFTSARASTKATGQGGAPTPPT